VPKTRYDLIAVTALQRQQGPEIAELEDPIAAAQSTVGPGRDEVRLISWAGDGSNIALTNV
jgi:hypothetical protein